MLIVRCSVHHRAAIPLLLLVALLIPTLILTLGTSAFAQTSQPAAPAVSEPSTSQLPSRETLENWRESVIRAPQPTTGCLVATYPGTQWVQVPCATPPDRPYNPARGPRPTVVGNSNDVAAHVTGLISEAIGSFDSVTGVTSETGPVTLGGPQVPNTFSLQLNSNTFSTPACNNSANPNCKGWEQFVYSNAGYAFIQYWLLNYGTTCPSGWNTSEIDCWKNGNHASTVTPQAITNLQNLSITAQANSAGYDRIYMSTGTQIFTPSPPDPATVLYLFQGWNAAEFNIFGDGNRSQANFNSGAALAVRTRVSSGTSDLPSCVAEGFTGETNNLSFASAAVAQAGSPPAIVFTESTAGGVASPCASTSVPPGQLLVSPSTDISAAGLKGGPFSPNSFTYELRSSSGCVYFEVANLGPKPGQPQGTAGWFNINPQSGQVCTSPINITIAVDENANGLAIGTYGPSGVGFIIPTVCCTGTARMATLTVNPPVNTSFQFLPLPNTPPEPGVGPPPPNDLRTDTVTGISADGSATIGYATSPSDAATVRWNNDGTFLTAPRLPQANPLGQGTPAGTNRDGSIIVGSLACVGFSWNIGSGTVVSFKQIAGECNRIVGVDRAGTLAVGQSGIVPALWTATSAQHLTVSPSNQMANANAISGDGTTVVGCIGNNAVRWNTATLASQPLPSLQPQAATCATAVNADGGLIAGYSTDAASNVRQLVIWRGDGPPQPLGSLGPDRQSTANAVSDNGVVVGTSSNMAFRWTAAQGMLSIQSLLAAAGYQFPNWSMPEATGVSADGTSIVGNGGWIQSPGPTFSGGWLAHIPLTATAPAEVQAAPRL
jgi:uncharacterized membrane protein